MKADLIGVHMPTTYSHFGILLFAQGNWSERDGNEVYDLFRKKDYGDAFWTRDSNTNCDLCRQAFAILGEIKGNNDGIVLVGGHDVDMFEVPGILELARFFSSETRIKKFIFFQGGPIKRRTRGGKQQEEIILQERLKPMKVSSKEFIEILEQGEFEEEILYEVTRDYKFGK